MKGLILLIALVVLVMVLAGPSASVVSDTSASLNGSDILDNEIATNRTQDRQFLGKCYNYDHND